MPRDYRVFLDDIIEAAGKVLAYTAGLSFDQFVSDRKTVEAVVWNLQVIGEAAKNIPEEIRSRYPDVSWRDMAGLRDIIVHQYFGIELGVIWKVVQPRIVQWFKTMTTSQYLNIARNLTPAPLSGRLWQCNYYEHIIRNEKELYAISEYITANPFNRREDPDNPDAGANPRLDNDP